MHKDDLHLISPDIEDYCRNHSQLPSKVCEELENYTRENVPMSVMISDPLVGSFLGLMVGITRAKRVLEVGCYTGYTALAMAEHLPEDGELITLDIDESTNRVAKEFWAKSPHGKKIRSIIAPASQTISQLKGPFDLVFIDADKTGYINYLNQVLELLTDDGVIIADNCLFQGKVVKPGPIDKNGEGIRAFNDFVVTHPALEATLLPVKDGLMMIRKR